MGYSCPVCGDPQADDIHLANHLAFTAITRGGDHEDWLDEHVPDWGEMDDEALAAEVTDQAEEREYPQVFEDTTGGHDHAHDHSHAGEQDGHGHGHAGTGGQNRGSATLPPGAEGMVPDGELDDEAREILAEAREMTRERRQNADEEQAGKTGDDGDESE